MRYFLPFWAFLCFWGYSFPAIASSLSIAERDTDRRYRDSLCRHIFDTGAAEFNSYLSYPIGKSTIDVGFGNNSVELSALHRFLFHALRDTSVCVRQVRITGYSSPDGSEAVNERIAYQRVDRLFNYLDTYYHISEDYPVEVHALGADWKTLRRLVAASSYPWRTRALDIIDGAGSSGYKKIQIALLGGGEAHRKMYEEFYPRLRRVEVSIVYDVECMKNKVNRTPIPPLPNDTTQVEKLTTINTDLLKSPAKALRPVIALKTNLLFDIACMPNLEVEVPLGKRWSLNGEMMLPWWLIDGDKYCLQVLSGGLEARYWLGNRINKKRLTGHFVGVYAGGGKYDLQWEEKGYQGEFFIASGLSYGYSLSLSRHWNMEFSLGVGLLRTNYRHYLTRDNYQTLLWQNNGTYTWIGPTKAKISLVWLIGNQKKGGRK